MKITRKQLAQIIQEEVSAVLAEKWKGDPEIEQTGEYADKSVEELCSMKKALMDKEERTKEEQGKVKEINFALRAKRGWKGKEASC